MVRKKKTSITSDLEQHFPGLYKVNSKWFKIEKRFQSYYVNGYSSIVPFGVGIERLYGNDFEKFIKSISPMAVFYKSEIIDCLILQIREKISGLIGKVTIDGQRYKGFLRPQLITVAVEETTDRKMMLEGVEPYVEEFAYRMNQLIQQLIVVRTNYRLDKYDSIPIPGFVPESFCYKNFEGDPKSKEYANLKALHNNLVVEVKYIHPKTKLKDFVKIFTGKPVDKPIIWMQYPTYLSYFIKTLISKEKIKNTANKHFAIADMCFVNKYKKHFGQDELSGKKAPTKKVREKIEGLVDQL